MASPLDNCDGARGQLGGWDPFLPSAPEDRAELLHRFACVEKKTLFTQGPAIRFAIPSSGASLSTGGWGIPSIWQTRRQALHHKDSVSRTRELTTGPSQRHVSCFKPA